MTIRIPIFRYYKYLRFPSFRVKTTKKIWHHTSKRHSHLKKAHGAILYIQVYDVIIVQLYTKHESSLPIKTLLIHKTYDGVVVFLLKPESKFYFWEL